MTNPTDVDLVYFDLRDAVRALDEVRSTPREVRRVFSRYVELSQRLTSAMRKDFKKRTHRTWEASRFPGWTATTDLLKYLRNQDQHEDQVFITVHDRHFYDFPVEIEISGRRTRNLIVDGHWHMTDQMLDRPPSGLELTITYDDGTAESVNPTRTESSYVLYPRNESQSKRIAAALISDVYGLVTETFATLTQYYEFYRREVDA
jgi:hypothetical protein